MKMVLRRSVLLCILSIALFSGCGGPGSDDTSKDRLKGMAGGDLKEVTPVSGVVSVDGVPTKDVYLYLHGEDGGESIKSAFTDQDGKFCFASYLPCDGLPAGSYVLTFRLMPEIPKNKDVGPDLFKGKYKSPKKSEQKLTVVAGTPQTDIKIDLKK